jgi:DNA-binding YbaB/EbfC family protein
MAKRGGFPGGAMPGSMNNLMKQAQRMQRQLEEKQAEAEAKRAELEAKEFKASAGGGAVEATVNGKMEVVNVTISPEAIDPDDAETLQDMIVAAVNEALKLVKAESAAIEEAAGAGIPGMPGLGGFGF